MRFLDSFQEGNDTSLYVGPGNTISQTFRTSYNNLSGVRLFVFNPRLGGKKTYILELTDESNNQIRQDTISESNLGWEMQLRYDFRPVDSSKNKNFIIKITYPEENKAIKDHEEILTLLNQNRLGTTEIAKGMEEIIDQV